MSDVKNKLQAPLDDRLDRIPAADLRDTDLDPGFKLPYGKLLV